METSLLRTFRAIATHGSITAAAETLGYTQSAVSRQVASLEAAAGARLFDRAARGVRLTEHGRSLLGHAEAVLERLDAAHRDLEALDRVEAGRLRVGAFPTAVASLIPRAMAAFAARHPGISLSLVEGTTHRLLTRLGEGDADLAVVSAFPGQSLDGADVDLVHLLDDAMLVALPRSHRLADRRRVRLAELAGESWIAAGRSDDDRLLGPARLQAGFEPRYAVAGWMAKLGLVAAGLGVTLVPSLAAAAAPFDVALVELHTDDAPPRAVYAVTPSGVTRSPATEAFLRLLADAG